MTPREVAAFNLGVESVAAIAESTAQVFRQRESMPTLRRELVVCVCEALASAAAECLLPPDGDGWPPAGGEPCSPAPANDARATEEMAA